MIILRYLAVAIVMALAIVAVIFVTGAILFCLYLFASMLAAPF